MPTASRKVGKAKTPAKPLDAIALLRADHKAVDALFAEYKKARAPSKKKQLVSKICTASTPARNCRTR